MSQTDSTGLPRNLTFDFVQPEEVRSAHALEVEGYPAEDAASYSKLLSRQQAAPHLFLGAYIPLPPPKVAGPLSGPPRRKLIAFITGTAAPALTLRAMSSHDTSEDAHMVCIHSVCVAPEYQRKGLATKLLEAYIARVRRAEDGKGPEGAKGRRGYETFALLAHDELTALYRKVGFKVQCHSHIQYGSGQWLEMRRSVYPSPGSTTSNRSAVGLFRTASSTSSAGDEASSPTSMALSPKFGMSSTSVTEDVRSDRQGATRSAEEQDSTAVSTASASTSATPVKSVDAAPPGMPSQASILAALAAQSKPGESPGVTYTSILGQAVAAKTPAEDAGMALEARLVNRDNNTNLAKLYCPMENCRCCILGKGAGEWTRKESGPLSNPDLQLPNSPSPPQAPAFSVHAASPGVTNRLLTNVKGFWVVNGPLQFDNVGFSRDQKWTVPKAAESSLSPRLGASDKEDKDKLKRDEKERKKELKAKEKRGKAREKRSGSGSDTSGSNEDVNLLLAHLSLGLTPDEELTIKYLLCPDCECGPLGFTILPTDLQGGQLAAEVGDQVERMKGGTMSSSAAAPKRPPQLFYLAADRVRYHFERT